jgi:16S rRNA (adenine1518-N6/adenine1519-N6)-dimethyltransferase
MSLEQIQNILLTHNIRPNKLLGQNFIIDSSFYPKLLRYAEVEKADVVLDAGAGFGFLAKFLSDKCRSVLAVEKDPYVASFLRQEIGGLDNVVVVEGDVLKVQLPPFNKVISAPPYYLSTQLVMWLLDRTIDSAVLVVQKEFAERLFAAVGSAEYGWLTVVVQQAAQVQLLDDVPKNRFYPSPEIDSLIVRLKPLRIKPFNIKDRSLFVQLTKSLFTERNKKLAKAIGPFLKNHYKISKCEVEKIAADLALGDRRPRELEPRDFGAILDALPN